MPDTKITALTALTAADPANDVLPIVDVSDTTMAASGTTKKISINNVLGCSGTATLASATITGAATVGTTLGVTGVSTFAAGTALLPAITTIGDTNTGIYYPAADTFAITTGGSERLRTDSSGNVGIGVTPSAAVAGNRKIEIGGNTNAGLTLSSSSANASARNWSTLCNFNAFGDLCFNQSNAQGGDPIAAGTTRMTLDASGNLILLSSNTPATLTTNGQLTVNATSNTNLRFSYRGSDGVTRTADLTLA